MRCSMLFPLRENSMLCAYLYGFGSNGFLRSLSVRSFFLPQHWSICCFIHFISCILAIFSLSCFSRICRSDFGRAILFSSRTEYIVKFFIQRKNEYLTNASRKQFMCQRKLWRSVPASPKILERCLALIPPLFYCNPMESIKVYLNQHKDTKRILLYIAARFLTGRGSMLGWKG